jgi:hypothetical protein
MFAFLVRLEFFTVKQLFYFLYLISKVGTKTMTTDGTKTIYSWDNDKGEIAQKTETVKRYSDSLENPLSDLANQIKKRQSLELNLD